MVGWPNSAVSRPFRDRFVRNRRKTVVRVIITVWFIIIKVKHPTGVILTPEHESDELLSPKFNHSHVMFTLHFTALFERFGCVLETI